MEHEDVVGLVAHETNETLCALMECALSSRGSMPKAAANHLREFISASLPNFQASTGSVVLTHLLRQHLVPRLVRGLVDYDELQTLLKEDEDLQSLICGLVLMNKFGRSYFLGDPGDKQKGVRVLESAAGNVDCLFTPFARELIGALRPANEWREL
jgi:hypothetical protein